MTGAIAHAEHDENSDVGHSNGRRVGAVRSLDGDAVGADAQLAWWTAALSGTLGPITERDPQSGFYRQRRGDRAVAFWTTAGVQYAVMDGIEVGDPDAISELWIAVAKSPVSKADYQTRRATGVWPGDAPPLPVRSNMSADPFEALKADIEDRTEQAAEFLATTVVDTQTKADIARNMQAALLALKKQADELRTRTKEPHLQAGRDIDAQFKPLIAEADQFSKGLRDAFQGYMVAEEARQKAAALAKFNAERTAAESARRAIAEAALQLGAVTLPEMPDLPVQPDPVKISAGGDTGRASGLKTVWSGVVDDRALALAHFADHPDVIAAVDKLVAAAVRAGKSTTRIPGVTITEKRTAA